MAILTPATFSVVKVALVDHRQMIGRPKAKARERVWQ